MLEISGIRLSLDAALPENTEMQAKEVARALGVSECDIRSAVLTRKSVDARKRNNCRNLRNSACLKGRQKA